MDHGVELLAAKGVALGFPYSSQLKGTSQPLRELRIQSGGHPIRVFYAFDPARDAVLLLGGDKTGDKRFYERMIPPGREDLAAVPLGEGRRTSRRFEERT
ncbi:type II toxin-antitoxin system RelE/ParE family toxin [Corallococcus coralloides]|uniref:type II toxin-antitoxin system RelE/ParE family toxin n=1 Tax=Corallococcus coralloides TaxID=184914 RepID=UPI00384B1B4C